MVRYKLYMSKLAQKSGSKDIGSHHNHSRRPLKGVLSSAMVRQTAASAYLQLQSPKAHRALSTSLCPLHNTLQVILMPATSSHIIRKCLSVHCPAVSAKPHPQTVGFPGSSCVNSSKQILQISSSASTTGTARLHRSMLPRLSRAQSTELNSPQVELVACD